MKLQGFKVVTLVGVRIEVFGKFTIFENLAKVGFFEG